MNHLGEPSKTTFLKGFLGNIIHEEFEVEGLSHTLTFSAALVTGNSVNGYVGGNAIPAVAFATDSDTTMAAVAAAISAMPGVKSASVVDAGSNDRVITIVPVDQATGITLTGYLVTGGASQATVVVADSNKKIYAGMPVELNASGKIQPLTAATASTTNIGTAIRDAVNGQFCTVALIARAIIYAKSADALVIGPVAYNGYDAVGKYVKVTDTTVTETNIIGWTLDSTLAADEVVRVALK